MKREIRKPGKETEEGFRQGNGHTQSYAPAPPESVEGEKDVDLFEELVMKRVERKGTRNEGRDLGGEVTGLSTV